jgi:hypothetical protein
MKAKMKSEMKSEMWHENEMAKERNENIVASSAKMKININEIMAK